MFTGIIDHSGLVRSREAMPQGLRLEIESRFSELAVGESIAVDGICLTVTSVGAEGFRCDVSSETLARTTCDAYRPGTRVNLERALRLGDRMGGHWVTGHVDTTGRVASVSSHGECRAYAIDGVAAAYRELLIEKGSVAVDGVSLTVNRVTPSGFEVMIVPHTLERTTIVEFEPGRRVNLELDWMVKLIRSQVDARLESYLSLYREGMKP